MMAKDFVLKLADSYLRNYPVLHDIFYLQGLFKLVYSRSNPHTNSQTHEESFVMIKNMQSKHIVSVMTSLSNLRLEFDKNTNTLKQSNSFDGILTQEHHEQVFQDDVFGHAHLNKMGNRWVYIAKKKIDKSKSYFLGGNGKEKFVQDFGETYNGINTVGIFVWDLTMKKIIEVDVNIGSQDSYIFAHPIFANDEGTKIICHGYKRKQFTHSLLHCFNRPVSIFEISLGNAIESKGDLHSKILINKQDTCIFANISPCRNYLLYFGGHGITHSYYMDLVILKKHYGESENEYWQEIHRKEKQFVGLYSTAKTETFEYMGEPYAVYHTIQKARTVIKEINLKTGEERLLIGGQLGKSYQISGIYHQYELFVGKMYTHQGSSFFYAPFRGKAEVLRLDSQQNPNILLQEHDQPIHSYYLECRQAEIKRQKKPVLVWLHGGPHNAIQPTLNLLRYILLKLGYVILLPNFSGSSGFGDNHLKNALGSIGQTDASEIISLLENVLNEKSHLDRQNVHVLGRSYGGYLSAILSSRYHKYFKSCIIMNGVLAIPSMLWVSDIPQWCLAETLKTNQYHNLTEQDYKTMFEQTPIFEPVKIPTLQFLGGQDLTTPAKQGYLFEAIAKCNGTNFQTYLYENANHCIQNIFQAVLDVALKSVMFFENIQL